jgi:hypothetical protein
MGKPRISHWFIEIDNDCDLEEWPCCREYLLRRAQEKKGVKV